MALKSLLPHLVTSRELCYFYYARALVRNGSYANAIQKININKGSYMSVHVLLNLLSSLRKSDKMLGKPCILSLFLNSFKKFNKTRTRMLYSFYHLTLNCFIISFWHKMSRFCHIFATLYIVMALPNL